MPDWTLLLVAVFAGYIWLVKCTIWIPMLRVWWRGRKVNDGLYEFRRVTLIRSLIVSTLGLWVMVIWGDRAFELMWVPPMADRWGDPIIWGALALASTESARVFWKYGR
jgi:hypothetical protein